MKGQGTSPSQAGAVTKASPPQRKSTGRTRHRDRDWHRGLGPGGSLSNLTLERQPVWFYLLYIAGRFFTI